MDTIFDIEQKGLNKLPSIRQFINNKLREAIETILDYTSDCQKGTISYTSDNKDVYEYTLNRYLTNINLIAEKTIKLYDNQANRLTKIIGKVLSSQSNDILRATLESIRDIALDYKDGTRKYSVPKGLQNANEYLFNNATKEIEAIGNNALMLYTADLINHSK